MGTHTPLHSTPLAFPSTAPPTRHETDLPIRRNRLPEARLARLRPPPAAAAIRSPPAKQLPTGLFVLPACSLSIYQRDDYTAAAALVQMPRSSLGPSPATST